MPESGEKYDDKVIPVLRGGASFVHAKPVFSADSKYVLCCSANIIKVLSISSGECVQELVGHKSTVTSIQINPTNQFQLLSCSLDKTVIKWDYADGVLLRRYEGKFPLSAIYTVGEPDPRIFLLQSPSAGNGLAKLVRMKLPFKSDDELEQHKEVMSGLSRLAEHTAVDPKGRYVASIDGGTLHVKWLKHKKHLRSYHKLETYAKQSKEFTSITCHPIDCCLATGTKDGKIIYWWIGDQAPVTTIHHWHSLAVTALEFTPQGSYLLSGGHECVLVKWQYNTQYKDFLPRLGSPLVHIATASDNTLYSVSHTDNGIHIISSARKVIQHYQGLTRAFFYRRTKGRTSVGLQLDPRTKCLVTNGRPGHLQFYDLYADKQLYNLDIVGQNYISPENLHQPPVITEVEKVAFTTDKQWLATYERRDDNAFTPETKLKLWFFNAKTQEYVLNTCVETPHSEQVFALAFRPIVDQSVPMLASTGKDGKFKLWTLNDDTDMYKQNQCWGCESVGFYHGLPARSVSFSEDGSLMAVAFGTKLTVWDPDTNALQKLLSTNQDEEEIKYMMFSCGRYCHLLLCSTKSKITVWNLLSCAVEWIANMSIEVMAVDPLSGHVAAFIDAGPYYRLKVYNPTKPVAVYDNAQVSTSAVLSALFVPRSDSNVSGTSGALKWQKHSKLYYINQKQELQTLQSKDEIEEKRYSQTGALAQNLPETPFSTLLTTGQRSRRVNQSTTESATWTSGAFLKEMLQTPAHVLPPISSLCMVFLDSLAIKSPHSAKAIDDEEDSDSDSESETESDSDSDTESDSKKPTKDVEMKDNKDSKAESTEQLSTTEMQNTEYIAEFSQCSKKNFSWMDECFQ